MNDALWTLHQYFAGAGMAAFGLGPNFACTFANDIDPKKGRSYRRNLEEANHGSASGS
jgi:DNA (cytosine-5)-methyltransferase 1